MARINLKELETDSPLHELLQPLADLVYVDYPWLGKHPREWTDAEVLVRVACKRLGELQRGEAWGASRRPRGIRT